MENIRVLEELFDQKKVRILKFLIKEPEREYYLREISKIVKVPVASTFRIIRKLTEMNLVDIITIKRMKLYRINQKSANYRFIKEMLKEEKRIVELFIESIRGVKEIKKVILYGKEGREGANKANLLLIGDNIPADTINMSAAEINEKYNFRISTLRLTEEQYEQMLTMGLYPEEKRVIFMRKPEEEKPAG